MEETWRFISSPEITFFFARGKFLGVDDLRTLHKTVKLLQLQSAVDISWMEITCSTIGTFVVVAMTTGGSRPGFAKIYASRVKAVEFCCLLLE